MMAKVKTLEDLGDPLHVYPVDIYGDKDIVFHEDLKKEIVKWIKEEKELLHKYSLRPKQKCQCPKCRQRRYLIGFLMNRFNIREEDLK